MCINSKRQFSIIIGDMPISLTNLFWRHLLACVPLMLAYALALLAYVPPLSEHLPPCIIKTPYATYVPLWLKWSSLP